MSHFNPGLISGYNSLTDKHLAGYFSNTRIRRHLHRAGLITRSGRIVPDREYRHKLIQRAHQRHVRECLAQAIFHKVLEMERVHQIEIKRRLEEFARRERVHKIKLERSKRYEEDIIRILSPRPPTGARGLRKQHSGPEGEHSESSESPGSSRPNTAPGKMQRPVRLKPIHSNSTTASLRRSSPQRLLHSSTEHGHPLNSTMDKESRRRLTAREAVHGASPYCLPVINNFVTPVPPATKRRERAARAAPSGTLRGRRLRPTTASSGADIAEEPPMLRSSVYQSRVAVTMVYFGKTVHLTHDLSDMRDEVKVFQQHCGGENLCIYKGLLHEGDAFQFISRRHRGFPFSLTFFLNGLQVERLSSCCEFKHRKGSRLGGRHGHFGFSGVEGASPCYKCIIAMGLDKKPTPPPRRVREDGGRAGSVLSPRDVPENKTERLREDAGRETSREQHVEPEVRADAAAEEDRVRDDYEEDFEADDEGPADDAEAVETKSPSPICDAPRRAKEANTSETEAEEDDDVKSRSGSSSADSDREEDEVEEQPAEVEPVESAALPEEEDETKPEEAAAPEAETDATIQAGGGDGAEMDASEAGATSKEESKESEDVSEEREVQETVDESKQEEEEKQESATSVQGMEEAAPNESQSSSEPREESTDKGPEPDNKDADVTVEKSEEEEKAQSEEAVVVEAEAVAQDQEASDPKEKEEDAEQQTGDGTRDEEVKKVEEDEKGNATEVEKLKETADVGLHPVCEEEETPADGKTPEPREDAVVPPSDAKEEEGEKQEEKSDAQGDGRPAETGQGAKKSEEGESLVLERDEKTDETAAADNAEAEVMTASETMQMKAEPSEEREALDCEEAPVTDAEERRRGDDKDKAAESEREVAAETSSGDNAAQAPAEESEDNAKEESDREGVKGEGAEEVSAVEDRREAGGDLAGEQTEGSKEGGDEAEERCGEEGKEEEKQTVPEETVGGDDGGEGNGEEKDKTEEEGNNESKTDEGAKNEESISELNKTDSNIDEKSTEQAEKTQSVEASAANEEKADESEKKEQIEENEHENRMGDTEQSRATTDKIEDGEKTSEPNKTDEEMNNEAEKEERDEDKAEQSEAAQNKNEEECEEKSVVTEGKELSEIAEEPEKSADSELENEKEQTSDENVAESEDVCGGEDANLAQEAEETPSNVVEAEDVNKEAESGGNNQESGNIDAENGESFSVENDAIKDEAGAQTEDNNEAKPEEHGEDGETKMEEPTVEEVKAEERGEDGETKMEEPTVEEVKAEEPVKEESTEVEKETVEPGEGEHGEVHQAPGTDVDGEAEQGDDAVEKPSEVKVSEIPGSEIKEEPDDREDGEANGNASNPDHENKGSDLTKMDDVVQSSVSEAAGASSDVGLADFKVEESTPLSDSKTDLDRQAEENVELSAADGEKEDTEEASKASEEGASVLLQPQAQTQQNNQPENPKESAAVRKETPEALGREDSKDLVTNWLTKHQTSRFFETFIEPLEDLKEQDSEVLDSKEGAADLPRSESPLKMAKMMEQDPLPKDVTESKDEREKEAVESEVESDQSEHGESHGKDSVKDVPQGEEEEEEEKDTEVKDLTPEAESEQNDEGSVKEPGLKSEERRGSVGSLKDGSRASLRGDDAQEDNTGPADVSRTEVESIAASHRSATSGRAESVSRKQTEEEAHQNGPGVEETLHPPPSPVAQEPPDGLSEAKAEEPRDTEGEASQEVTEITDFTASRSDDGSQEESHDRDAGARPPEQGDRRNLQLIQEIHRTLSKDRLSTFSVDEALFGPNSYPLLSAARAESGH